MLVKGTVAWRTATGNTLWGWRAITSHEVVDAHIQQCMDILQSQQSILIMKLCGNQPEVEGQVPYTGRILSSVMVWICSGLKGGGGNR